MENKTAADVPKNVAFLEMNAIHYRNQLRRRRRRKFISPIPPGGHRKGSSAFLSRRPFGTIFASQ